MPTDRQLEMKLEKQTRKYKTKQWWTILKMEDLSELFCPDCKRTITDMFAGKWIYVTSGRAGERLRKIEMIHKMIMEDYDRKQIVEKIGFKSQQHLQYYLNLMSKK